MWTFHSLLTVFQSAPTGDHGHAPRKVVLVVRHAYGNDVQIVADGRLELQQGYVVFERGRVVLPVHDDAFHVFADAPLGFHFAADVVLAENGHQVRQEPANKRADRQIIIIIVVVGEIRTTSEIQILIYVYNVVKGIFFF